jgi:hypothetical protein
LSAADIAKTTDLAVKAERLARGEAADKAESKSEITGDFRVNVCGLLSLAETELGELYELADEIASQ